MEPENSFQDQRKDNGGNDNSVNVTAGDDTGGVHVSAIAIAAAAADDNAGGGRQLQIHGSSGFGSSEVFIENANVTRSQYISPFKKEDFQKWDLDEMARNIPPLKLNLKDWQSLAEDIQTSLSGQQGGTQMNPLKRASNDTAEKVKPSIPALQLKIGSWERVTKQEGDLVAKCYYGFKRLVWEFLENSSKKKIEFQWADVVGIKATFEVQKPGILELELKKPPSFKLAYYPFPSSRKSSWSVTGDFTEGRALMCRRHYLKFPPGLLERPYKQLLQCDERLNELSKKPFPTFDSPYFPPTTAYGLPEFSLGISGQTPQISQGLVIPHSHMNPSVVSAPQVQSCQPTTQMQPPSSTFSDPCQPTLTLQLRQPPVIDLSSSDSEDDEPFDNPGKRLRGQATDHHGEAGTSGARDPSHQAPVDSQFWHDIAAVSYMECSGNELSTDTPEHFEPWILLPAQATPEMPQNSQATRDADEPT